MKSLLQISLIAVVTCCLVAAGCQGPSNGISPELKVLKVGSVLSKTGPAAAYGGDADRGARLALQKLQNDGMPFEIEYISQDDKSDKTEAAKVARSLIEAYGVDVILGPAISPSALSVGKLAEERDIPMIGTSPTQDEVTASDTYDRKYVFRVCFNDSFQGRVLARFAREHLDLENVAIIYDKTSSYSIGLAKTFREVFENLGGAVAREENYSVQDTDYSALIDKVARFDVQALFIPGWDENVGPMLKQAGNRWDKFVLLGGDAWPTSRFLELAAGNTGTSFALSHFIADDPNTEVTAFNQLYSEKYGELPSAFVALGYDAMLLIADAARRAGSFQGPLLQQALAETRDLKLVTGSLRFDQHRNPMKEAVIVKILPDRFVFHKRIQP